MFGRDFLFVRSGVKARQVHICNCLETRLWSVGICEAAREVGSGRITEYCATRVKSLLLGCTAFEGQAGL